MTDEPTEGKRERAKPRSAFDDERFAARYADIDEVAALLGVKPVTIRQTMARRAAGDAPVVGDALIEPVGHVHGYLWDRADLTDEAIAAWRDRPKRASWLNPAASADEG